MEQQTAWYLRPDGSLDMILLLAAFQEFFAEHSQAWLGRFEYQEAGPHLMLMAFLQRIVNGGGRIHREFAAGSGRADLVVEYGGRRAVLELKVYRGEDTEKDGIAQLCRYLDRLGETEGHLLIFDRRKSRSWADKIDIREVAGAVRLPPRSDPGTGNDAPMTIPCLPTSSARWLSRERKSPAAPCLSGCFRGSKYGRGLVAHRRRSWLHS